jgi:hypothetical protein
MDWKSRNMRALSEINMRYVPAHTPFEFLPMRLAEVFQQGTLTDFVILVLTCGTLLIVAILAFLKADPR